jgi:phosphopantothenoylcysteine synthetase/decarboxylase
MNSRGPPHTQNVHEVKFRPVIVAPAMNTHMWDHPVTASQLDIIKQWGYTILQPQVSQIKFFLIFD